MKKIIIFLFIVFSYSADMQILAKHFTYDKNKNISIFKDDVNITKENDNILSNTLYVYTNKKNKLQKIVAIGNVKFRISDQNSTYKGQTDKLIYNANKEIYKFEGNVHITKLEDNQQIFGNKVIINKKTGNAIVDSDNNNTPIKFILKVK